VIGLFLSHEAQRWRTLSRETAFEAAMCGVEGATHAGFGRKRDAIVSSAKCLANAGLSFVSGHIARALDSIAAGQPDTVGGTVVVNVSRPSRRTEDVN
jgi:hypothetical protein